MKRQDYTQDPQKLEMQFGYLLPWSEAERIAGRSLDWNNSHDCNVYHSLLLAKLEAENAEYMPFTGYEPEPMTAPDPVTIIEAAQAYRAGQSVTVKATAYHGRHSDNMSRSFRQGDSIQYECTVYDPVSFSDWIIRTKVFLWDWFYGMDKVFFSYYIG